MTWTRRFLSVAVSVAVALSALPLMATSSQAAGDVPGEVVADVRFQAPPTFFSDYVDGEYVGGGLLVAGDNRVRRYLPSGALDPNFTFAPAGWDLNLGTFDFYRDRASIALGTLPDGTVLVGAKSHPLVRINAQTGEQLPLAITNADQAGFTVDDVSKIVIKENGNTADVILLQPYTAGTVSPLIKKFVWRNGQLNRDTNFCPYFADRDNGCVADVPPTQGILAAAFLGNGDIVIGGGASTLDLPPGVLPSPAYKSYSRPSLPPAECRGLEASGLIRINSNGTTDRDWSDCVTVERGFRVEGGCSRDCRRPIEYFEMRNPRPLLNFGGSRGAKVGMVQDIAVTPDGEIVAVGTFDNYDSRGTNGVVRVNGDGTISQTYSFTGASPNFNSVALYGERVIAVGRVPTSNKRLPSGVVRFNANGRWDRTFMGGYTGAIGATDMPGLYSTVADGSQERGVAYAAIPVPANPSFPSGLLVLGDFDTVKSGSPLRSFPRRSIVLLGDVGEADSILNEDGTVGSAGDAMPLAPSLSDGSSFVTPGASTDFTLAYSGNLNSARNERINNRRLFLKPVASENVTVDDCLSAQGGPDEVTVVDFPRTAGAVSQSVTVPATTASRPYICAVQEFGTNLSGRNANRDRGRYKYALTVFPTFGQGGLDPGSPVPIGRLAGRIISIGTSSAQSPFQFTLPIRGATADEAVSRRNLVVGTATARGGACSVLERQEVEASSAEITVSWLASNEATWSEILRNYRERPWVCFTQEVTTSGGEKSSAPTYLWYASNIPTPDPAAPAFEVPAPKVQSGGRVLSRIAAGSRVDVVGEIVSRYNFGSEPKPPVNERKLVIGYADSVGGQCSDPNANRPAKQYNFVSAGYGIASQPVTVPRDKAGKFLCASQWFENGLTGLQTQYSYVRIAESAQSTNEEPIDERTSATALPPVFVDFDARTPIQSVAADGQLRIVYPVEASGSGPSAFTTRKIGATWAVGQCPTASTYAIFNVLAQGNNELTLPYFLRNVRSAEFLAAAQAGTAVLCAAQITSKRGPNVTVTSSIPITAAASSEQQPVDADQDPGEPLVPEPEEDDDSGAANARTSVRAQTPVVRNAAGDAARQVEAGERVVVTAKANGSLAGGERLNTRRVLVGYTNEVGNQCLVDGDGQDFNVVGAGLDDVARRVDVAARPGEVLCVRQLIVTSRGRSVSSVKYLPISGEVEEPQEDPADQGDQGADQGEPDGVSTLVPKEPTVYDRDSNQRLASIETGSTVVVRSNLGGDAAQGETVRTRTLAYGYAGSRGGRCEDVADKDLSGAGLRPALLEIDVAGDAGSWLCLQQKVVTNVGSTESGVVYVPVTEQAREIPQEQIPAQEQDPAPVNEDQVPVDVGQGDPQAPVSQIVAPVPVINDATTGALVNQATAGAELIVTAPLQGAPQGGEVLVNRVLNIGYADADGARCDTAAPGAELDIAYTGLDRWATILMNVADRPGAFLCVSQRIRTNFGSSESILGYYLIVPPADAGGADAGAGGGAGGGGAAGGAGAGGGAGGGGAAGGGAAGGGAAGGAAAPGAVPDPQVAQEAARAAAAAGVGSGPGATNTPVAVSVDAGGNTVSLIPLSGDAPPAAGITDAASVEVRISTSGTASAGSISMTFRAPPSALKGGKIKLLTQIKGSQPDTAVTYFITAMKGKKKKILQVLGAKYVTSKGAAPLRPKISKKIKPSKVLIVARYTLSDGTYVQVGRKLALKKPRTKKVSR